VAISGPGASLARSGGAAVPHLLPRAGSFGFLMPSCEIAVGPTPVGRACLCAPPGILLGAPTDRGTLQQLGQLTRGFLRSTAQTLSQVCYSCNAGSSLA
jgi:hypothetical protein